MFYCKVLHNSCDIYKYSYVENQYLITMPMMKTQH